MFKISNINKIFKILLIGVLYLSLIGCGTSKYKKGYRTDLIGKKVVKTAYTQMGKKYRYGGKSPRQGFDCSGLIWWAYDKHNITVPRVTKDQAKHGRAVRLKYARLGDIVVFRTGKGAHGLHTGIYSGKNTFIHSPKTGARVRVESLSVPYWSKKLIRVRRYVK